MTSTMSPDLATSRVSDSPKMIRNPTLILLLLTRITLFTLRFNMVVMACRNVIPYLNEGNESEIIILLEKKNRRRELTKQTCVRLGLKGIGHTFWQFIILFSPKKIHHDAHPASLRFTN